MRLKEFLELRRPAESRKNLERDDSMKKYMIIVTGCPGCGKTSLAGQICRFFPEMEQISYDAIKEQYFDRYGFDNASEKARLNERSLESFYRILDDAMAKGRMLLIEYPFCKKHAGALRQLAEKRGYSMLTILLTGDMRTLYLRGIHRDDSKRRHLGHLLNRYHLGVLPEPGDWIQAMEFEEYVRMCREKDYDIRLGETIRVDVTDIGAVDAQKLCRKIRKIVI